MGEFRVSIVVYRAGEALGPWLAGYLNDITGSYRAAMILVMVCSA